MEPTFRRTERDEPFPMGFVQPPETADGMLGNTPRPHKATFFPYGYELRFETNSESAMQTATRCFGAWRPRFDERPMQLRCLVTPSESAVVGPVPPFLHRIQHHLLTGIADKENFYCCDLLAGFAFVCVTLGTAEDVDFLRVPFEDTVSALLWTSHVVAIHAACVMLDGHGVLLAGDSGAGKSSLAYACARRGWTYISDDTSCLVKRGEGRTVIGNPHKFRFRETAGSLFPEFLGFKESRRAYGKPTIEVSTGNLAGIERAAESCADYIVFLNRTYGQEGRAEFVPVPREEKLRRLFVGNWPSDLPARQEDWVTLQRLASVPAFELRYRELDTAMNALERLVRGKSC
jgi:hypothetical protein